MLSAILFALSSFGAALPRHLVDFVVARFVGGIAIGDLQSGKWRYLSLHEIRMITGA